ncbi:MAG: glycosyltransferase family 4 protein [Armatimonadota bacterium]
MHVGITTFGCDSGKSGISSYTINVLQQFCETASDDSFEVVVAQDEKTIFMPRSHRAVPLVVVDTMRSPINDIFWHITGLPRLAASRKYDAMFFPAGNRRLPWNLCCPSVACIHDMSWLHVPGKYDRSRLFYLNRILPSLIRKLSKVITVSESSKKDIMAVTGLPSSKVQVIWNGADTGLYFPRDKQVCQQAIAQKYGIHRPYIMYISRLEHPGKNHVGLIHAYERLRKMHDIKHMLVLPGNDREHNELVHAAADASKYKDDIVFLGFTPTEDLPLLYGAADLFVFPSLYEGFGIPIAEAMHCGTPVCCSNVSSMPEVLGDAGLTFDPEDPVQMAQVMSQMLLDQALRQKCVDKGLERAKLFTWKETATRTLNAIREVARS